MTQYEKILTLMAKNPHRWFMPYDFMKQDLGSLFVGYKAPTRIAELAKDYPDIFESEPAGKYVRRRLKLTTLKDWYYTLPNNLRKALREQGVEPKESPEESLARQGLEFADD